MALPSAYIPQGAGLINAIRTGRDDFQEDQKRELMKSAGGLAAAGNYGGAANTLLKGGEIDAGFKMKSHLKAMNSERLAIKSQAQDKLARIVSTIQTPEQLETAKAEFKKRGFNVDSITFDQLPRIRAEALSVKDQMAMELNQRKADIMEQRVQATKEKAAGKEGKLTEGQATAQNFLGMLEQAEGNISGPKPLVGPKGESPMGAIDNSVANSSYAPNWLKSAMTNKTQKAYIQAAMQFTRAKLRKESGATISPDEFYQDYITYFPQPGDDQRTLRQKADSRKQIIQGFRVQASGRVLPSTPSAPDPAEAQLDSDLSKWGDDDILKGLGVEDASE